VTCTTRLSRGIGPPWQSVAVQRGECVAVQRGEHDVGLVSSSSSRAATTSGRRRGVTLRADPEPARPSTTQCSCRKGASCLRERSNERGKWAGRDDQHAKWPARVVSDSLAHRTQHIDTKGGHDPLIDAHRCTSPTGHEASRSGVEARPRYHQICLRVRQDITHRVAAPRTPGIRGSVPHREERLSRAPVYATPADQPTQATLHAELIPS
jgi:hypothetical protein